MKKLWRKIKNIITDNFEAEESRLLLILPFLFACGIAIYFALPFEPSVWLSIGIFELWLLIFYLCRHQNLHYFFISGIIIISGFLNIQAHTIYQSANVKSPQEQTLTYLSGHIKDISLSDKGKMRLLLDNANDFDNPLKGKYRITLNNTNDDITIGKCVEMAATLFPNRQLPILNGFKLDRKYFYENLSAIGYANSEVFIIDCPQTKNNFITALNKLRGQIINYINNALPSQQSGIADALLVGEKTHISPQIRDNYRNSGLAHFLSVSGLHLGTIAALVFFAIRFLIALFPFIALRTDSKKIAAIIAIIFSSFYLLISGIAIPAQRAFIMTTVVLLGIIFNRQAISMRMVSFAALVILIIEPQTLVSVSFQMSFAAVYALVAFYEVYASKLSQYTPKHNFVLKIFWYLCGIVLADFVASVATLPFALYHFHRVAVYTSLGNLLAGPLIGLLIMPMVLLCLICLPLHIAFYPLKALGIGIDILNNITDYVAHLPHSVWYNNNLTFSGLILIVCGAYWLCIWQQPWRRWGIIPIIVGAITILFSPQYPDMVFSDDMKEIAIRDNNNSLVWLPYKNNSWIKKIWQENLSMQDLSKKTYNQFKAAIHNENEQNIPSLNLVCSAQECVYRQKIKFAFNKYLKVEEFNIDISQGGCLYLKNIAEIKRFSDTQNCRIWQNCYQ